MYVKQIKSTHVYDMSQKKPKKSFFLNFDPILRFWVLSKGIEDNTFVAIFRVVSLKRNVRNFKEAVNFLFM